MPSSPIPDDSADSIASEFLKVKSSLRQYLLRFVIRRQDVEDALQETFLRAFQFEQSGKIRSPKSFLYRVGRNLALSERATHAARLLSYTGDLTDSSVLDEGIGPEQALEIGQRMQFLSQTIAGLPPQCRRVLIMRKVYGLSHKEVARRLDVSVKTVEQHLTKALQHCQEAQSRQGSEPQVREKPLRRKSLQGRTAGNADE